MSWFFIQCGPLAATESSPSGLPPAHYTVTSETLNVRAGGPELTCIFYSDPEHSRGFVVCGTGLLDDGNRVTIMQREDWQRFLFGENSRKPNGGHYACFAWSEKGYRAFNDELGIREIFFTQEAGTFTFSTHLESIASTRKENLLDPSAFGGKWYLYFQCDHKSPIAGIDRLGPNASLTLSPTYELQVHREPIAIDYIPQQDRAIEQTIIHAIERYTTFPFENGYTVALSLSGGVDSRIVLAALRKSGIRDWQSFTFGLDSDGDVKVSRMLAEGLHFPHITVHPPQIHLEDAEKFVTITDLFKPASASYPHLSYPGIPPGIVIDGAPGELLRRRLFTKLEYVGGSALKAGDWEKVIPYLWTERPTIWNPALASLMRKGAREQVIHCAQSLPPAQTIGTGNWIDSVFTHMWFSNTSGADQRRLDGILLSTSPFSQPLLVRACFQAREEYRKHGRLSNDILKQLDPVAMRYPYAKDEILFPSWVPWYLSKLYAKLMKKRSPVQTDTERFLTEFKSQILDTLGSRDVRECTLYDYPTVESNVNAYYAGDTQHAAFVDWWFSVELWRRNCNVTGFAEA